MKVHLPSRRSGKGFVSKLKCQVTSDTTHKVMISREMKVASYKEICGEEKIKVYIGYNNQRNILKVEDNKIQKYPFGGKRAIKGTESRIIRDWDILGTFFSIHNIEPTWLNCHMSWGGYSKEKGAWTGCMGKVGRDNLNIDRIMPSKARSKEDKEDSFWKILSFQ